MKKTSMIYTVKRLTIEDLDSSMRDFLSERLMILNYMYGNKYDWTRFPVETLVHEHIFLVCYRNDIKVGFLVATYSNSIFDERIRSLTQRILYADPGTLAAHYLLAEFIDIGRRTANHVVTMIGSATRIKPRSLEALGFEELETYYRLEI